MNQTVLKAFAPAARTKLQQQVAARLNYVLTTDTPELRQRVAQVQEIRNQLASEGQEALVERVAYTWFNRLAALRFMDANGYHPFNLRVVTPNPGLTQPELLMSVRQGNFPAELGLNQQLINDLLDGRIPVANKENEVYRQLFMAVCNYYNGVMPFMFEKIADSTELLLPEDLLSQHSIVADFQQGIAEDDCTEVELIGWLYQFYISEKKDVVMGREAAVPKEDIPAVTQIFTPHWIVRYLVENSLGRLWLLNRPQSRLRERMPYYIEGEPETDFLRITSPTEIRMADPAVGSGHILTYAYDLFYAIYEEEGYDAAEIPGLILKHNLYGIEICDRAAALAAFALFMKARGSDNRFFRRAVQPNIISLQESRFAENELRDYIRELDLGELFNQPVLTLLYQFEEAKNFGSLIQPVLDEPAIRQLRQAIETRDLGGQLFLRETHAKVLRALEQAEYLSQRYHVVVANPPYMGSKAMNNALKVFSSTHYPDAKSDLMTCFMERCRCLTMKNGRLGMINLPSWLFLSSFEDFRYRLVKEVTISSLLHLGRGMFGSDFGSVAFVFENRTHAESAGSYRRLFDNQSEVVSIGEIEERFHDNRFGAFNARQLDFLKLPGCPIAYWISPSMRRAFEEFEALEILADTRIGMATGKNASYVRYWHEVATSKIGFQLASRAAAKESRKKWFPYAKGGEFRKWYGNSESVVDWSNDGHALQTTLHPAGERIWAHNFNLDQVFRPAICWTVVTIAETGFRYHPEGYIFDAAAGLCQPKKASDNLFVLGALNSRVAANTLKLINPTVNLHPGYLGRVPIPNKAKESVGNIVSECLTTARNDWDNFETSWDFRDQPLLRPGLKGATLAASWQNWKDWCDAAIRRMQDLETENNRLFIEAYGLQDELKPEVPEDQITLARADAKKDMAAFVSYAIGCMFGRYSLNKPGLVLANTGETVEDYRAQVAQPTFMPDEDNILPILDGEWFADDIVAQFKKFLRVTFGEEQFAENLAFVEESLGKDIRKYFLTDFYKDHLKTYKKRPIYWMFSSPRKSFNALIYLHRYNRDTVNLMLNDYLREFQVKLRARKDNLVHTTLREDVRAGEKTRAQKEITKIDAVLSELAEWERDVILPLANRRLEIDLDDGVKVNYLKFGAALQFIPGLEKKEED